MDKSTHLKPISLAAIAATSMLSACGGSSSSTDDNNAVAEAFSLDFKAMSGVEEVNCDTMFTGYGSDASYSLGVSDLRFYVSNIKFYDQYDVEIEATLDENEFQYQSEQGFVALIDLTGNSSGTCALESLTGTARTNTEITGTYLDTGVAKVSFDLGLPQAIMKDVIATTSAEDAPSPLNEMYWSWASGYRHFVMNFAIEDTNGESGEGYLHIGSRNCTGDGLLALETQDECDFINTPKVELDNFDPAVNTVVVDIESVLADVAFSSTSEGVTTTGVSCHSAPSSVQADCGPIFVNFGISAETGDSLAADNSTVVVE
ncbi:MbnP family copper-binding protein [Paraglaciecola sp.]|uniref:MbnP family copper-binding protein n=1 Tax=Paraglaciecola sp. TaxID=1920173 RepID=UPI003267F0E2